MKKTITWKRTTALATCALMLAATAAGGFAAMDHGTAAAAENYTVDVSKGLQEFDGWGLSLSWWATEIGDWTRIGSSGKEKREEIAEALYGPTGLNLNIARYNVGGGDDPTHTHMSDDRNTPGWRNATKETKTDAAGQEYTETVLDDYVWVGENGEIIPWTELQDLDTRNDYRQLWVLDWIQNEHGENGQNDYISEFYSNSPPWWMTMTGCSSGGAGAGQNLASTNNQAFVEYFLDVYEYLTSQGFEFGNLQPFNESGSYYWGVNGDQEGCYFSANQKVKVLSLLQEEMERRGLDVPYNWGDETNTNVAYQQYGEGLMYNTTDSEGNPVRGADVIKGADRYTYHIYWYDKDGVKRMYRLAHQDGKEIYMSEICCSDTDDNGDKEYDPESLTTGFKYTQSIIDTVKHGGVDAYVFWQGMEDMVGQMKGGTNYGLIQGVYYTQEEAEQQGVDLASMGLTYQDFVLSKAYYMSGQYTKYIRPGYQLVDVNDDNTLAAVSPDGETLVIVKQNSGNESSSIRFDLNGFNAQSIEKIVTDKDDSWTHSHISVNGNYVSDTVSDRSVTTYVIHGKKTAGDSKFVDESAFRSKADLTAIKDAFAAEGSEETEQYYYSGFGTNGGNSKYFGDTLSFNAANGDGYVAFRFKGTGFGITAPAKGDAAQFGIWVDTDPATAERTATCSLNASNQENGKRVYSNNTLEDTWHTVYIKGEADASGHTWVNLDGIFIYTSADAAAETDTLKITSASGVSGTVGFNYEVTGCEGYTVYAEYLENGADWQRTQALDVQETNATVAGIEGNSVRLRLVAEKSGAESIYSPECTVRMQKTAEGVLYFVDCGAPDAQSVAEGAVLGELQSATDRQYGTDPVTGKTWGYTNTLKGASKGYYEGYEAMTSVMSLEMVNETALEYKFALPAGTYHVTLGFYGGGDGWGTREERVTIGNEPTAYIAVRQNTYDSVYKKVTLAADGELVIKVAKREASQDNSLLSLIAITEEDATALPLYTSGVSGYNTQAVASEDVMIGANVLEKVNAKSFTLYKTDGTAEQLSAADAKITVSSPAIVVNQNATATYEFADENVTCTYKFRWMQEGGSQLYYNIDCGYTTGPTPPDDATLLGTKQSTTRDRQFGEDSEKGTSWGYYGGSKGCNWENDNSNEWSIREGDANSKTLVYKMTGFKPNEALLVTTGGHMHQDWGGRTYDVICNGTKVGDITLPDHTDTRVYKDFETTANAAGELEIQYKSTQGDAPHVGYIKVYSNGTAYDASAPVGASKTAVLRSDVVTLSGLENGATVYITDENGVLLDAFRPASATQEITVGDILPTTSYELHITQARDNETNLSPELILAVEKEEEPEIEYILEEGYVAEGDAAVILFVPHTELGVTSLTLKTPDGVNYNVMDGFYYRATKNGVYTVTLVSGAYTVSETFTVNTIDTLDLGATFSETGWTAKDVTVTLAPEANSGIKSVTVDGAPATAQAGKYSFTAAENGDHKVVVVTNAGFEYERTVTVSNIDKTAPELALEMHLTADGVSVGYTATSASGGKVMVAFNGAEREVTESAVQMNATGKYEVWFVNGAGAATAKTAYYVTYGLENAQLATVTADDEGLLTVTAKSGTATSALYRAGEETAVSSMKAEKVGKYYLDITSGSDREIVVLYVQSAEAGGGIGDSNVTQGESSGCGGVIAAPAAAIGAIVIVCVAAAVIFVKRRKNS